MEQQGPQMDNLLGEGGFNPQEQQLPEQWLQQYLRESDLQWRVCKDESNGFLGVEFASYRGTIDEAQREFDQLWDEHYFPKPSFEFGIGYAVCLNVYAVREEWDANAVEDNGWVAVKGEFLGTVTRLVTWTDDRNYQREWYRSPQGLSSAITYMFDGGIKKLSERSFLVPVQALQSTRRGPVIDDACWNVTTVSNGERKVKLKEGKMMTVPEAMNAVQEMWTRMHGQNRFSDCYIVVQAWETKQKTPRSNKVRYFIGFAFTKIVSKANFSVCPWGMQKHNKFNLSFDKDKQYEIKVKILSERSYEQLKIPVYRLSFWPFAAMVPVGEADMNAGADDGGGEDSIMSDYPSVMADALLRLLLV